jgi:hypothetical protein
MIRELECLTKGKSQVGGPKRIVANVAKLPRADYTGSPFLTLIGAALERPVEISERK